jgi:hypothetical protein|tara:strand:- start:5413 stop:5598 length:186 start_codon:yes stop_codon:yes gene_type:complete
MQFEKKTRIGNSKGIFGILIKIILTILGLAVVIILIDRINFPSPVKKIEKIISNENYKIVK